MRASLLLHTNYIVELGVVIRKSGANIKVENAMEYVGGYCVALDLTARNIQVCPLPCLID